LGEGRSGARAVTSAERADRGDRLSRALAPRGVGHGDRVAYLGLNDIATFETFFATTRLGAIFVPLNTRLTAPEIAFLLTDARPTVLIHGPEAAEVVRAAEPAAHGVAAVVPLAGGGPDSFAALVDAGGRPGASRPPAARPEVGL
ncbi:MAG: AMP-binding protein, partial [Frankia sp.]